MVRSGEDALQESDRPTQPGAEGTLSQLPRAETPESPKLQDFPILSQIHQEVGTMASVVNQINHISDFIQGRAPSEPQPQTQQTAAPHETATAQATPAAPQQPAPQPQVPPAQTVAPAQQAPHAEPAPTEPEPVASQAVSEEAINALYDRLYAYVEGVAASGGSQDLFRIRPPHPQRDGVDQIDSREIAD